MEDLLFFLRRKANFGAKMRREETQERAKDVGPKKEKKRKRERERKRGKGGPRERVLAPM